MKRDFAPKPNVASNQVPLAHHQIKPGEGPSSLESENYWGSGA